MAQAMGAGGGAPAPQPQGPPTGPFATPQERAFIQQASRYPQGSTMWIAGLQKAQEIQQRAMTPMAPPEKMMWGSNGRAMPIPGTETTQLGSQAPGEQTQQGPFGDRTYASVPNAVSNGQVFDPMSGGYKPLPGLQPQVSGNMQPGTVTSQTPGSAPTVVQAPVFEPEKARAAFLTSPEVQKFNEARTSTQGFFNALQDAAGKNNGVLSSAALNTFFQSTMPGTNPRAVSVDQLVQNMGFPEALQSAIMKATGGGAVTPEALNQIARTSMSYVTAARQSAMDRMNSDTAAARGYDPKSTGVPGENVPAAPTMPAFKAFAQPQAAPQQTRQAQQSRFDLIQDARMAIAHGAPRAAVIQRLQGMGVNPAEL
jgi:hypothetical protein